MVRSVKNNLPAIPTTPIFSHTARTVAFPNSSGSSTRLDFEPVKTLLCDLANGKCRLFIPFGTPKYSTFIDVKFNTKNID